MKKILLQSSVFLLLLGLMSTSHSQGNENRYIPVFCGQGHSIQDAVDRATEGATINVWGTCHEAVLVDKDRLRFFGLEGLATIIPPCCTPAFQIIADSVSIEGFNITGAVTGIAITHGSHASIVDNVISDSGGTGIRVVDNSQAILVRNQVVNSGNSGIWISGSSQAMLSGNTTTGNTRFGVGVAEGSSARFAHNIITENTIHGISVQTNGTVDLRNTNIISRNGEFGVSCEETAVLIVNRAQDFSDGNGAGNVDVVPGPPSCFVKNLSGLPFP
jgi:parallel beta-helix repeat protein